MKQPDLWTEVTTALQSYGVVAALAVVLALSVWPFRSRRWLPIPRLRPGEWTGVDVFLILFWMMTLPALVVNAVDYFGFFNMLRDLTGIREFSVERKALWSEPLSFILFMALSSFALFIAHRTRWNDLGMSLVRWPNNIQLGCAAFLIVTLPALLVYLALRLVLEHSPHAMQSLAERELNPVEWALVVFALTIAGPVKEEWVYRGVLQGWLRRASPLGHYLLVGVMLAMGLMWSIKVKGDIQMQAVANEGEPRVKGAEFEIIWPRAVGLSTMVSFYAAGVWMLWRPVRKHGFRYFLNDEAKSETVLAAFNGQDVHLLDLNKLPLQGPSWERWKYRNAQWSVVGSSALFAIMHFDAWPAPIPLFFLSLALGWLALRTQNLLPSILAHSLFNLVSTIGLFWESSP